ncbi:MAG: hypothetical protein NTY61_00240 [Candidatus Parcubacteria bacterium]|nr:hypothetical protein [Candidatus Parcubacteria bacterium]
MLTNRQNQLLKTIVHQYIETAQPVGSEWLAKNFRLDKKRISSATIRNEMTVLLEKDFLSQPHTSAGRVPTEKAYHYFIKNLLNTNEPGQNKIKQIEKFKNRTGDGLAKELSQTMAELTGELAIMAFDKNNFYYTGFSNLFSQPEFSQPGEEMSGLGQVVDHLDYIVGQIFDQVVDEPQVLLGRENPFGDFCSTILTRLELPSQKEGVVFGLLGPLRMDYERNIGLINYVKRFLNN